MRLLPSLVVSGFLLATPAAAASEVVGRVVDDGGRPVAGATIVALAREGDPEAASRRQEGRARPALATVTSGDDGAFRLDLATSFAWIEARRDGFVPSLADASGLGPVVLTLRKATTARGVATSAGRPVADAVVVWNGGAEIVARTAADGSFSVPDPERFPAQVFVFHPNHAPWSATGRDALAAKLDGGVPLQGTALDEARRPAADAAIFVDGQGPLARSDARGVFRVAHAPRSWTRVVARTAQGVGSGQRRSGPLVVTVRPERVITGTVTDARSRRPVAGATVMVQTALGAIAVDTDARGAYRLAGLEPGQHRPIVGRTGYKTGPRAFADPDGLDLRLRLAARLDVALEPLARVEGRVEDEERRPVAGATVGLWFKDSPTVYVRGGFMADAETVTAADGTFTLLVPDPEDMPEVGAALMRDRPVVVLKDGFAASQAPVARSGPTIVTLSRGVELTGRVTGPDGAPLAGVDVSGAEDGEVASLYPSHLALGMIRSGWVQTDVQGRFAFRVRPQPHHVGFRADGFAARTVRGHEPSGPLEVALEPAAFVRGRFSRADGSGIAGAAVSATAVSMMAMDEGSAVTDDDGRFEIGDLPPGVYQVRLYHQALGFQETRTVQAPTSSLDVVLAPGGTLRGQVLEAGSRRAVTRFEVWTSASSDESWRRVEVEDAGGTFAVGDVPFGDVKVWVGAEGYVRHDAGSVSLESGVEPAPLEVLLEADAPVVGRVTDAAGRPVEAVRVAETKGNRESGVHVRTDANGEFEMRGLAPGEVELVFQAKGFATTRRKADTRAQARLDVTLDRGLALRGEVVRNGAGVAGAFVGAFAKGTSEGAQSAQTDAEGRFAIEGLAAGRYSVSAFADGRRVSREDVDPATAGTLRLALDGTGNAVLVGRVVGLPVDDDLMVMVSASNEETGESSQAGVEGGLQFRMSDAPAGRVKVQAFAVSTTTGLQRTSRGLELDVAPGSTTDVVVEFGSDVTVGGLVIRDGAGLPWVNVAFNGPGDVSATTRTDAAGAYRIDGLAAGTYQVHVSGDKLSFATRYEVTGSATFDIDVTGATLRGRAVRAVDGAPVAGVEVSLFRLGVDDDTPHAAATSGAQGTFEKRDLPEGRYRLITSKVGFGQEVVEVDLERGSSADVAVELRPSDGLQLKVVDKRDGRALDAIVVVRDAERRIVANRHGGVADDGSLTIPLANGTYTLSTSANGFGTATLPVTAPAAGLVVELTPGGTLVVESATPRHGKVRLRQPNGDEYVRCWCNGIADIELKGRRTTIENVTPGTYTLELVDEPEGTKHPVVVREGQTSTVTMD